MAQWPSITVQMKRPASAALIRVGTPDDAESVLDCAREVFATTDFTLTKLDEFTLTLDQERDFLRSILDHPKKLCLIAVDPSLRSPTGQPLITAMLVLAPKRDNRRKLRHSVDLGISVRSSHRGRGMGRLILAHAINWARSIPELQLITLEVYADNTNAIALYQSLGFIESGRQPLGLIHDDNTAHEQVAMWLNLNVPHTQLPTTNSPV